ncbi:hypothetical protein GVN16_19150 [Emticicia sp. CRIBPO]|uniref:hypothetical protein n=1 Tax=Emticicia sp. CRIBPO TaxID=2683258 RepID=UPI00141376D2|nr:hypothetical protein [Emticicia sp. CRIBPO]NBA87895.1 hypothetical protein [Emticicia sp. CRIBPO]
MKKEERFRKLIQKAEPDKPSSGFSAMVMQQIEAEAVTAQSREVALDLLLKQQTVTIAPLSFGEDVMQKVLAPKPAPKTVSINKVAWYSVAIACMILITLAFLPGAPSPEIVPHTPHPGFFAIIAPKLGAIPMVYPITFFALGMLVGMDYLLRRKLDF